MEAVRALGYTPDPVAKSMRTGATLTVGFIANDTGNPLIAEIGAAAQLRLDEAGYALLVTNSASAVPRELANLQLLRSRRVDGLLLSVADETNDELRSFLSIDSPPAVLVDREISDLGLSAVHSDHRFGMDAAIAHLVGYGHRRVALISGSPRVRPSRERALALREALDGFVGGEPLIATGEFTENHGYDATMALMSRRDRPTALISGSNQILVGVLRALRDLRIQIPVDLSLITCDSTPLAELTRPEIATVGRDTALIGRRAAELLLDRMAGNPPRIDVLPTTFDPAASCAAPFEGISA